MNAKSLPTKLTLTCQINSTSKSDGWGGGNSSPFDEHHLMVTLAAEVRSDSVSHLFKSTSYQMKLLAHYCICPYNYHANTRHTHTSTHTHWCTSSLCSPAPSLLWALYVNETVAVSWHNINYSIKIEWVINCPSLPALITLAEKGHLRGAKVGRGEKDEIKQYKIKN